MKEIHAKEITVAVEKLCIDACTKLGDDWWQALDKALSQEESPLGKDMLRIVKENANLAATTGEAICQDTGTAVVFLEMGQDVRCLLYTSLLCLFHGPYANRDYKALTQRNCRIFGTFIWPPDRTKNHIMTWLHDLSYIHHILKF